MRKVYIWVIPLVLWVLVTTFTPVAEREMLRSTIRPVTITPTAPWSVADPVSAGGGHHVLRPGLSRHIQQGHSDGATVFYAGGGSINMSPGSGVGAAWRVACRS